MSGTVVSPSAPIIEFTGVCKSFGEHMVYDHMALAVRAGETLTIIGGSGLGKSVCLKMMIGLLRPDSGSIRVRGQEVTELDDAGLRDIRHGVAYVFQGGALFDSMNVHDNVAYALREHTKMNDPEVEQRVIESLELVGLDAGIRHSLPARLSGGMKKRVALARSGRESGSRAAVARTGRARAQVARASRARRSSAQVVGRMQKWKKKKKKEEDENKNNMKKKPILSSCPAPDSRAQSSITPLWLLRPLTLTKEVHSSNSRS